MLWTASLEPFWSPDTLSHTSMMAPQSSDVRFSSVALAAMLLASTRREQGEHHQDDIDASVSLGLQKLTDDFVKRPSRRRSEHGYC